MSKSRPQIILWLTVLLGVIFRARQYFFNRSLWSDEALLALNFLNHPLRVLLTQRLDDNQAAPLGFLLITKIFLRLGITDLSLRLFPFLSSLLALALAVFVSLQFFKRSLARIVFVGLMACSPILIYYASEFKQYSSDVFFFLFLLALYLNYRRLRHSPHAALALIGLGVGGVISTFCSHPSLFILPSLVLLLVWEERECIRSRQFTGLLRLGVVGITWLGAIALVYFLSLQKASQNSYLHDFWLSAYAPFPPRTWAEVRWYGDSLLSLTFMSFFQTIPISVKLLPQVYDWPNLLLAGLVGSGLLLLLWRARQNFFVLILPVLFNLVASVMQFFPFRNRLVLYLVPLVFLILASWVDAIVPETKRDWNAGRWVQWGLGLVLTAALFSVLLPTSIQKFVQPTHFANIKTAMRQVQQSAQPGDVLVYDNYARAPLRFYERTSMPLRKSYALVSLTDEFTPQEITRQGCLHPSAAHTWMIVMQKSELTLVNQVKHQIPLKLVWTDNSSWLYQAEVHPTEACQ